MPEDELKRLLSKLGTTVIKNHKGPDASEGLKRVISEVANEFVDKAQAYIEEHQLTPDECFGLYYHDPDKDESAFTVTRTDDKELMDKLGKILKEGLDKDMFGNMLKRNPMGMLRVFAVYPTEEHTTCSAFRISLEIHPTTVCDPNTN